ncbi:MAG: Cof-type HAD-IIB family hydrolase [Muribaculaceae bacterium]|nr:Cof-type HAD-IIB family hydrolase [Muribaculaceae bacterium]
MSTLYITDLDGTFLGNDARVSPESASIVSELSHRGALISVATARTPATVVPLMADTYTTAPMVVMTGAGIWNRARDSFDNIITLSPSEARAVMRGFDGTGVQPFCYTLGRECLLEVYHAAPRLSAPEKAFVDERAGLALKHFNLGTSAPEAALDSMVLAFAMGPREAIVEVARRLSATTSCYVSYYKDTYTPDLWLLEVFAGGVSKASGVKALAKRLGATRVVAFGDNLNDIPMLRAADVAVAVGNALDDVKAVADVVIGDNSTDAVARYIKKDFEASL